MTDSTVSNPSSKRGMQNNWASNVPNASEHEGTITTRVDINPSVVRTRGYGVGSVFHQFEKAPRQGKEVLTKRTSRFSVSQTTVCHQIRESTGRKGSPLSDKYEPIELKIHSWDPSNPTGKGVKVTDRAKFEKIVGRWRYPAPYASNAFHFRAVIFPYLLNLVHSEMVSLAFDEMRL